MTKPPTAASRRWLASSSRHRSRKAMPPKGRRQPVAGAAAGNRSGEEIYKATCAACHDAGVANAPKLGDKAAWAPRIALKLDGLVKSAIAGKNAMPPKGGSDANDAELTRTIVYMANKSGASFKEPGK
jgi:cytochrome c5